jgi:hypothetical protein
MVVKTCLLTLGLAVAASAEISVRQHEVCLLKDGALRCQDGFGKPIVPPYRFEKPRAVVAGEYHTCVLDGDLVKCWGTERLLGKPPIAPEIRRDLKNPRVLAAGGFFETCAIDAEGVKCWDYGADAVLIPHTLNAEMVSVGPTHYCAVAAGRAICWGGNDFGQATVPPDLKNIKMISTGQLHTCALNDLGITCWGNPQDGATTVPATLKNPSAVYAGGYATCARDESGIQCWGDGSNDQASPPSSLGPVSEMAFQDYSGCALKDETLRCWGVVMNPQPAVGPAPIPPSVFSAPAPLPSIAMPAVEKLALAPQFD